ncbi:hypothetical protein [Pseudomonas sp. BN606]|uniref:hypothetical protein n=1 Tax=Pseudomonas sp. BN606 TaxID=2567894 RepID=UPI002454CCC2|nr:hypothetical protein [Pseudomonas sp. BN606]MDH4656011.1 hypothetical protein [Pseudomonas sp. BN606]
MTAAKLRIDLSQGLIEVEGTEDFILEIYGDFKERLGQVAPSTPTPVSRTVEAPIPLQEPTPVVPSTASTSKATKPAAPRASNSSPSRKVKRNEPKFLSDLDLTKGKLGRLKDFHGTYAPKTNMEHNLIFTYFLKDGLDFEEINEDHLFTCYRATSIKIPKALRQSVLDTAQTKGWVETDPTGVIRLTIAGRNHLEHDLAKNVPTE